MAAMEEIFNHLVLPPKLPGSQDENLEQINRDVITRLIGAARTLKRLTGAHHQPWMFFIRSLWLCKSLHAHGYLEKHSLIEAFRNLSDQSIVLYVMEQNAALMIHQNGR